MYTCSYMWIWPDLKLTVVMQPSAPLTCQTLNIGINVIVSILKFNTTVGYIGSKIIKFLVLIK